ncbi:MAG: hypothetical protein ACLRWL_10315 [Evtepia gabavorous]
MADLSHYTTLLDAINQETHETARIDLVDEFEAYLDQEKPFIPLWFTHALHVQSKTVTGIDYPPRPAAMRMSGSGRRRPRKGRALTLRSAAAGRCGFLPRRWNGRERWLAQPGPHFLGRNGERTPEGRGSSSGLPSGGIGWGRLYLLWDTRPAALTLEGP